MKHYTALEKGEIMPSAATWMDREIIVLSGVSQREKDTHHVISLLQHDNLLNITPTLPLLSLEVLLKQKLEKAHFSSKSLLKLASPSFSSSSSFLPSGW